MTALPASANRLDDDMSPTDVVTGEAVLLDLRPASFATRMVAIFLDLLALGVVAFVLVAAAGLTGELLDEAAAAALSLVTVVLILVGIPAPVETLSRGRSLGKLAMGVRVVRDDGGPIRFRHALVRALAGVGELWLGLGSPAVICSLANERGKRVGDLLAGTYVVRERSGGPVTVHVPMPPELQGWARSADIGRLPDHLAMALRQFLGRATSLNPASRARLAHELARQAAPYVAPPPPAGTHPERFLAAVVAERRDRELRRLAREHQAALRREHVLHRLPFGLSD